MSWRTAPVNVEKFLDELRIGVKGQSNPEIARTLRNVFRNSVACYQPRGRATNRMRGSHILPTSDELRMRREVRGSEGLGAKVQVREGNNPDHPLRSPSVC